MKKKGLFYLFFFLTTAIVSLAVAGKYFFSERSYFAQIPVGFFSSFGCTPYIDTEIEGSTYQLEMDTGAVDGQFILKREILDKINKRSIGTWKWMDLRGNEYESKRYVVPKIKFKKGTFSEVEVQEENVDFLARAGAFWGKPYQSERIYRQHGRVGLSFFKGVNWFFDFSNSVIFASSSIQRLTKEGYDIENMIQAPFELTRYGIILKIETDLGKVKLALDTGASHTVIRHQLLKGMSYKLEGRVVKNSKFVIENVDFGNQDLYPVEFSEKLGEMEGSLGMDFLRNHVVYLDFTNKLIYIGRASEVVPLK